MNNSNNANDNQPHTGQEGDQRLPTTPTENLPQAQPATDRQLQDAEQKIEERLSAFERSMLRLTWAAVLISLLSAAVFAGQLYEMHEAGVQTDKLLSAAKALADAASDTATAAGDQVDAANNFSDTAEDINRGISGAVDQLKAAAKNAKDSIQKTQDSFRADQRAWVGLGEYRIEQFSAKDPFKLAIPFVNSGKSPAVFTEKSILYAISPTYLQGPQKT